MIRNRIQSVTPKIVWCLTKNGVKRSTDLLLIYTNINWYNEHEWYQRVQTKLMQQESNSFYRHL